MPPSRSRNKYNAVGRRVDGIYFDSTGESRRYEELKLLQDAGHIRNLRIHKPYPLVVNDVYIVGYEADFVYDIFDPEGSYNEYAVERDGPWLTIVEDVKGQRLDEYKMKAKLMLAVYGIRILETVPPTARRAPKRAALL